MSAELLTGIKARRITDASDLLSFTPVDVRQVYGQPRTALGPPAGFCAPYLRDGQPWITAGFIDGTKIEGTDAALPSLGASQPVYAVCRTTVEMLTVEGEEGGGDLRFASGRYTIDFARLSTIPTNSFETSLSQDVWTRSRLLFTTGEDGSLPVSSSPHFHIAPDSLTF